MKFLARILALGAFVVGLGTPAVAAVPQIKVESFIAMFTAPNFYCPPCERMKPIVKSLQREGFPIVIISDAKIAAKVGIKVYPTFVTVVERKIVKFKSGVMTKAHLKALLPLKYHNASPAPRPTLRELTESPPRLQPVPMVPVPPGAIRRATLFDNLQELPNSDDSLQDLPNPDNVYIFDSPRYWYAKLDPGR